MAKTKSNYRNRSDPVEKKIGLENNGDITLPFSLRREYSKNTLRSIRKRIKNRAINILAERALEGLLK